MLTPGLFRVSGQSGNMAGYNNNTRWNCTEATLGAWDSVGFKSSFEPKIVELMALFWEQFSVLFLLIPEKDRK